MKHTIKNPLALRNGFSDTKAQEFVSKEVAEELLETLHEAKNQIEYLHDKFRETGSGNQVLVKINKAIKNAEL